MTAERFQEIEAECMEQKRKLDCQIEDARGKVRIPAMSKLRPVKSDDIRPGLVVYYPRRKDPHWEIVDEVRIMGDTFNAYVSDLGCNYGLQGAFVRK